MREDLFRFFLGGGKHMSHIIEEFSLYLSCQQKWMYSQIIELSFNDDKNPSLDMIMSVYNILL